VATEHEDDEVVAVGSEDDEVVAAGHKDMEGAAARVVQNKRIDIVEEEGTDR
jgi:hypothetical protein